MRGSLRIVVELVGYEALIVPKARREIRRWTDAAAAIPNPALRQTATSAIAVDASNAEAAAAFRDDAPAVAEARVLMHIDGHYDPEVDSLEYWHASTSLPRELLALLPPPNVAAAA